MTMFTPSESATTLRLRISTVPSIGGLDAGLLGTTLGRAADVEGPHRQLGARLADGLRRDDADRLAVIDRSTPCKVTAITLGADALTGVAGQHGADLQLLDVGLLQFLGTLLGDLLAAGDDHVAGCRVLDVLSGCAAKRPLAKRHNDFTGIDNRRDADALVGAAIVLHG